MAPPSASFPLSRSWRQVAAACCPPASALDEAAWQEAERIAGTALAKRPARVVGHLRWFLAALPWLSLLVAGRPFGRLSLARRVEVLRRLERSPVAALRRGVWGLRTLAFLAVYGRPGMREMLGWSPDPGGWSGHVPADLVRPTPSRGTPALRLVP
ncbi:MAG: hypothetical protein ACK53W_15855 [Gemmatimonadota bacterium]